MKPSKQVLSWAFYDWANSAFATTVMAGFFPIYFKEFWCSGVDVSVSIFRLGMANSIGSFIVIIMAPLLGAMADQGSARKRFLAFFAVLGIIMTSVLSAIPASGWPLAITVYVLAVLGFSGANIFYDALMISVAPAGKTDEVSAWGFGAGYLGGGLLFAVNVAMTLYPSFFGLANSAEAVRVSFVSVAAWWAFFSFPLMMWVKEPKSGNASCGWDMVRTGFGQLRTTFRHIRKLRTVSLFLVAYWFYIDGVDTIIRMAVDYGLALGFDSNTLILALLITQFIGFPAAILFGLLGARVGTKKCILAGIGVYIVVTGWAVFMEKSTDFYVLAIAVGLVQGGVQALSRSFYARLIPVDKTAEFFGFYNMLGKSAALIGPLMVGGISTLTGQPRLSILSVIVLFFIGGGLLLLVDERKGIRLARQL